MTVTIGLITTGRCEHLALPSSLARVFAGIDVEFRSLFHSPADSLTSNFVSYPAPHSNAPSLADRLANRIVAEVERRDGPDFVFAVDDLELPNVATPANVTGIVCNAIVRVLGNPPTHQQMARVRERCSFHLLCPMVEAYFYGEPAALTRAGATLPAILSPLPLEDFATVDVPYLAATSPPDHKHPKRYLQFLSAGNYKETREGKAALATLDWAQVFAHQPPGLAFAHALFEDIADALGTTSPFPGAAHPATACRSGGVLRNVARDTAPR
jgi:hypothetical protein